jgi:phosphoribosylaminoimidazole-succinocarboxamide synthase
MLLEKGRQLYSGKEKTLYQTNDPSLLIIEFRDDTSAFDGVKIEKLTNKGCVNCALNTFLMQSLEQAGIATHLVKKMGAIDAVVKHLDMIPLECVVRNIAFGSLCRRLGVEERKPLSEPLFELFYKNDELHDPLVTREHACAFSWATTEQLDQMQSVSLHIHTHLTEMLAQVGLILVDAKYEFGVDVSGQLCLGDEISPDSCRIWDAETQKSLDKDRFRKDMGGVIGAYEEIAKRLGVTIQCCSSAS